MEEKQPEKATRTPRIKVTSPPAIEFEEVIQVSTEPVWPAENGFKRYRSRETDFVILARVATKPFIALDHGVECTGKAGDVECNYVDGSGGWAMSRQGFDRLYVAVE